MLLLRYGGAMRLLQFYLENTSLFPTTDKETRHCYISMVYDKILSQYDKIDLLEIGVGKGHSVLLWSKFFPNGRITGIDSNASDLLIPQVGSNYSIVIGDAYQIATVEQFGKFDIIIDDGPHSFETQKFTLNHYHKLLKSNGKIIIEDIASIDEALLLKSSFANCDLYDLRNVKSRHDDLVIIRRKGVPML